jgi:hypothetical protein
MGVDHRVQERTIRGRSDTRLRGSPGLVLSVHADLLSEVSGHGDRLFATDAPDLVWNPLASWILAH